MNKSLFSLLIFSLMFGLVSLESLASSPYLGDSVGVERIGNQTFILHKVSPQETLFGISRRYQVSVGEIQQANEVLKQGLKIGQTIKVPFKGNVTLAEGQKIHKVAPGETLFSISKKYGTSIDSLKKLNNLAGNDLSVGQSLKIGESTPSESSADVSPASVNQATSASTVSSKTMEEPKKADTPKPVSVEKKSEEPKKKVESNAPVKTSNSVATSTPIAPGDWMTHTVEAGETLFSLSSKYQTSVENLIQWNGLTSNNLKAGQKLKVGRAAPAPSTVPIIGTPKEVSSTAEMESSPVVENTSGGFKNIRETGLAETIEGTGSHKKYLVLHRDAPVGSIMRIKNEENDITIFARVVGTLPDTGDNSKLLIKLSQAAYDQLKAVNPRFPVEVLY
ncbi:LysM peptidoglycan-binding domain-containing protein [Algoriphagus sanaruensis]|nr:LysM peptidoglycan-binding domain-containing protein [Algoriphagus sanaruensis]